MKFSDLILFIKNIRRILATDFPQASRFGLKADNSIIEYPFHVETPSNVFIQENVKIRNGATFINSPNENIYIKKYSVLAANCTIVTAGHKSIVGIPHFLLGSSHINDKSSDIIIEEDVWVGTGVTLLPGAHLGRGSIIGAGSIISKKIPPYAVVVGSPSKIIKSKFTIDEIIEHEMKLYKEEERIPRSELVNLFNEYFEGKGSFGIKLELTQDENLRLEKTKSRLRFVEPY